jgi:DNA cross-link repair 1A protein
VILFELPNNEIYFHTGDFRFSKEKFMKYPKLKELTTKKLNGVFLDTTYCDPQYILPTQENVLDVVSTFVKNKKKDNTLFVIGSYTIGKERICEAIANKCNCKIFVTPEKYEILLCLDLPYIDIFTTNPNKTNIHFVNMFDISFKRLSLLFKNYGKLYQEIIGIKPTGLENHQ